MPPTATDLAWAAGIIDGEGCISLHIVKSSRASCFVLRVSVANTSVLMLSHLREIFGCGTTVLQQRAAAHHKPRWNWQVCSKQAETVLRQVEPYLVNKREEARVGLLSRELMQKHGRNGENPHREQLAWLKTQLSTLKGHQPAPENV